MKIKFTDLKTLEHTIVNVKHGTIDDVLNEAANYFNNDCISQRYTSGPYKVTREHYNQNEYKEGEVFTLVDESTGIPQYLGDILYVGKTGNFKSGRTAKDWSEEKAKLDAVYSNALTAKELAVASGLPLGQVYYLCKIYNLILKAGKRGRQKKN